MGKLELELFDAIFEGNLQKVQSCIERDADVRTNITFERLDDLPVSFYYVLLWLTRMTILYPVLTLGEKISGASRTPLDFAREKGLTDIIICLLKAEGYKLYYESNYEKTIQVFTEAFGMCKDKYGEDHSSTQYCRQMISAAKSCIQRKERNRKERERKDKLEREEAREKREEKERQEAQKIIINGRSISCEELRAGASDGKPGYKYFLEKYQKGERVNDGFCSIQSCQEEQKALCLLRFVSDHLKNASINSVKQGFYLPSFKARNVEINGMCTAITRGVSQALLLKNDESFLSNLKHSAAIYERIAQGKQISKREEIEFFSYSRLLNNFERQLDSATNSLPLSLIHNKCYKTFNELSSYITRVKDNFAIHLVTSNHVVAIYKIGDNYSYFDSNVAFVFGLKSIDQLMQIVEKAVECTGYKMEEKGFLVEHFDVDKANNLLSDEDKQVLTKEIKTERQLLTEQDKNYGFIKIRGQELSRVQLYDFGTKININGSIPLLINAGMNLSSKKFQDFLSKEEVSMTAREYVDYLKDNKNIEVVQAAKFIPFQGSKREIEEAQQMHNSRFLLASFYY